VNIRKRYAAAGIAATALVMVVAVATQASGAGGRASVRTADPANAAAASADALVASRPAQIMSSSGEAYTHGNVIAAGGLSYVPYERTYRGLRVVGGDFVVVTDAAGKVVFTSVAQESRIGVLGTTPTVSRAAAESVAGKQLSSVSSVEGTQLVVYTLGGAAKLAWQTTVVGRGAEGDSRLTVTVDAKSGAVLDRLEHVMRGTGNGNWSGTVTIATTSSGGVFSMSSPVTSNMPCQDAANNTTFTGPDDVWGNGVGTNRETGCVDAFYGAETEATMLSTWLGRNGMDGAGGAWPIRVGLNDLNAFYNGRQVQIGHNSAGAWIGSIDVIAHEMGHGIDDHTPGGISRGGTQEFVADVFGASTETFANNPKDPADFLVGEEVNLVGSGPIRNMYDPSQLGDPNCYSKRIARTEVHAAAGPGNPLVLPDRYRQQRAGSAREPDVQRQHRHRHRRTERPEDLLRRHADEDQPERLPQVPALDPAVGEEPVPRRLCRVQRGQSCMERDQRARAGRRGHMPVVAHNPLYRE
jgi:zinc metalloprotease ZmpA